MHQNASLCRISRQGMRKDYEKLFTHLEPPEPPAGLFDRIILAIKYEQELRNTKRLAFGFLALLTISLISAPFSWLMFLKWMNESGVFQFVSVALNDLGAFFALWPDFILAIVESLPIAVMTVFFVNIILLIFTLRLFLRGKKLFLAYLRQTYAR